MSTRVSHDGVDRRGCLFIERGQLWYERGGEIVWSFPVDSVRVVGEAFDPSQPEGQEQILIFLSHADDWEEAPATAQCAGDVLRKLGSMLGFQPALRLTRPSGFTSAAMYPVGLIGEPVLEIAPLRRKHNPFLLLIDLLFPRVRCDVSTRVKDHLKEPPREEASARVQAKQ